MSDTIEIKKEVATQSPSDITDMVVESWNDMRRIAAEFAKSSLIPSNLKDKPNDVLVILQQSKELGIGPIQGLSGINVIQGKPSVSPELQLALIRRDAPKAFISIDIDPEKLRVKCTMAPSKDRLDEGFTSFWDMDRAKAMGLAEKDNYKKQPLTMLKWRAVGEAARTVFPHITKGLYNSEEAFDLERKMIHAGDNKPSLKDLFVKKEQPEIKEAEVVNESGLEIE